MEANSELQRYTMLAGFFLPEGILEWFDVVRMEESENDKPAHELDVLYPKVLHIHLDERDNRQGEDLGLVSNGFTEESVIHDYPARSRKMVLHVRRRRYKDAVFIRPQVLDNIFPMLFSHCKSLCPFPIVRLTGPTPKVNLEESF